ncbi:hypothetical protein EJB05_15452, partial [Eragrostis curvula]
MEGGSRSTSPVTEEITAAAATSLAFSIQLKQMIAIKVTTDSITDDDFHEVKQRIAEIKHWNASGRCSQETNRVL